MPKTWKPKEDWKRWLKNHFDSINDGGMWLVPATGQVFMRRGNSLIWTNEDVGDPADIFVRTKIIGSEITPPIEVYKESEI